jgi:hypothetical protein
MVTELCGFSKGISNEIPAFRLTDSVFKFTNQKMLEGYAVIWQKLLIV